MKLVKKGQLLVKLLAFTLRKFYLDVVVDSAFDIRSLSSSTFDGHFLLQFIGF